MLKLFFLLTYVLVLFGAHIQDCSQTIHIQELRKPFISSIPITKTQSIICVFTPKTKGWKMISISFLPTSCIDYSQDQFPEQTSTLQDFILFKIHVKRDKCISNQQTIQHYSILLKPGIQVKNGIGFDTMAIVYFAVAIVLTLLIYFPLVEKIQNSKIFRPRGYQPL